MKYFLLLLCLAAYQSDLRKVQPLLHTACSTMVYFPFEDFYGNMLLFYCMLLYVTIDCIYHKELNFFSISLFANATRIFYLHFKILGSVHFVPC